LAKLIQQDDNRAKIDGIKEYNKLRGRIIDKSKLTISSLSNSLSRAVIRACT
jgi:hypothetical protein